MVEVRETPLPGVGVRHEFTTAAGDLVGVLTHRTGWRELLLYDRRDRDLCRTVRLEDDDTHTLAELLGASRITEQLGAMQQEIRGIAIDWLTVLPSSELDGRTIASSELRKRHGVTIVAVARGDDDIPVPPPEFEIRAGDVIIVVGRPEDVTRLRALLTP